ncbi:MAG: hypothetical protein ACQEQE_07640, partial [Bacillota bacterium]
KTKRIINIPADSIRGRRSLIYLDFEDLKLKFTPNSLYSQGFYNLYREDENTYGRITSEKINNDYSSLLKGYLPRGTKAKSNIFHMDYKAINNNKQGDIEKLSQSMNLGISYKEALIEDEDSLNIYKFDGNDKWIPLNNQQSKSGKYLSSEIDRPGYYIILEK